MINETKQALKTNSSNYLDKYKSVAKRVQEARKELKIGEGWGFKAFTTERGDTWALHIGEIWYRDKLISKNCAFTQNMWTNTEGDPRIARYNDGLIAKGETTALGRALVECGYEAEENDDFAKLLVETGLKDDDGIIEIEQHGVVRKYETVAKRRKDFRHIFPVTQGWGVTVDVEDFVPNKTVTFCASIISHDGYEVAHAQRVCSHWDDSMWKSFEKYATESVGRALGMAGFIADGAEIASAEEGVIYQRPTDDASENDDEEPQYQGAVNLGASNKLL